VGRDIDLLHLGRESVICAYERDRVIVDPGPESCLPTLLEALGGDEPRAVLLTHVHLDHAGAAGALVRRFPGLRVYVHERGVAHVLDPSRLVASAARLYGEENMARLWGEVLAVPEPNLHVVSGGETVEGHLVGYTPGHASHHVAYLSPDGEAFAGDVAGLRLAPGRYVAPATPPPDFDLEAWRGSLDMLEEWAPRAVSLTHFGSFEDVEDHVARLRDQLDAWTERARPGDREAFVRASEEEYRHEAGPRAAEALGQASPASQSWLGLERYWRKRAERETPRTAGAR
jgi:glyoxylase-like metal-dependent hydrolase (beta-lactamase superfamily II)